MEMFNDDAYPSIGQIFYANERYNEDVIFTQRLGDSQYTLISTTSGRMFLHKLSTPLNNTGTFYELWIDAINDEPRILHTPYDIKEIHFFETQEESSKEGNPKLNKSKKEERIEKNYNKVLDLVTAKSVAEGCKLIFDQLVKVGFTEDQAMRLLLNVSGGR